MQITEEVYFNVKKGLENISGLFLHEIVYYTYNNLIMKAIKLINGASISLIYYREN